MQHIVRCNASSVSKPSRLRVECPLYLTRLASIRFVAGVPPLLSRRYHFMQKQVSYLITVPYLRLRKGRHQAVQEDIEMVYGLFPVFKERQKQLAGTLSGGEQQMLAIGRGLMARPKVLLLDEPSLGLAPLLVQEIFHIVQQLWDEGTTILFVEQNARAQPCPFRTVATCWKPGSSS